MLGEAAVSAGNTDTFLNERHRRISRQRGKKHLLPDPDIRYRDLCSAVCHNRTGPDCKTRTHTSAGPKALRYKVTLEPDA